MSDRNIVVVGYYGEWEKLYLTFNSREIGASLRAS